jgi:Tfp pilus assembly protein PilN
MSELNLIPYELKIKRVKRIKRINYISSGIIVFAILFAIIYIPKLYLNKLISDELDLEAKISTNTKIVKENQKLLANIKGFNLYNKEVDLLTTQKEKVTYKIKNLEKYIPVDVSLTAITYSKGTIMISGVSTNYNSISAFAANLQMSKEYPIAKINNINSSDNQSAIQAKGYTFNIAIIE